LNLTHASIKELYRISSGLNYPVSYIYSNNEIALNNSSLLEWLVFIPLTNILYVKLSGKIPYYFLISSKYFQAIFILLHLTHESRRELKLILFGFIPIDFISSNKLIASFNLFFLPHPLIKVLNVISSN
jgi:hypothetical protein